MGKAGTFRLKAKDGKSTQKGQKYYSQLVHGKEERQTVGWG